jgi:Protein of unknown function (DUF2846)
MKPAHFLTSLALSVLMLGASAHAQDPAPPAASDSAPAATPSDAATPSAPAATDTAAAAESGSGTVIFFRPSKFIGAAVGFKVRENGTELGKLRNGKYFVLKVAPGVHQYEVHSETKDVLTLEVEAGQTYYVQGVLGVGIVAGRPNLTPSDAATFEGLKAKLKEVPPLTGDDDGDK